MILLLVIWIFSPNIRYLLFCCVFRNMWNKVACIHKYNYWEKFELDLNVKLRITFWIKFLHFLLIFYNLVDIFCLSFGTRKVTCYLIINQKCQGTWIHVVPLVFCLLNSCKQKKIKGWGPISLLGPAFVISLVQFKYCIICWARDPNSEIVVSPISYVASWIAGWFWPLLLCLEMRRYDIAKILGTCNSVFCVLF